MQHAVTDHAARDGRRWQGLSLYEQPGHRFRRWHGDGVGRHRLEPRAGAGLLQEPELRSVRWLTHRWVQETRQRSVIQRQ